MTELKPCPFCGSDDVHVRNYRGFESVECLSCLVKVFQIEGDEPETYWNRRAKE